MTPASQPAALPATTSTGTACGTDMSCALARRPGPTGVSHPPGSGTAPVPCQGSVPTRDILTELPALAREITSGELDVTAQPAPLSDAEQAWADTARAAQRIILTP